MLKQKPFISSEKELVFPKQIKEGFVQYLVGLVIST
jgi:hypothetical protein